MPVDFANYATGVAILIIMLKYLDSREKKWEKRDEAHLKMAEAQLRVAKEQVVQTKVLDKYIRLHNGHQTEIHHETMESFKLINEKLRSSQNIADERDAALQKFMADLKDQHVGTQHVDKQIVKG